MNEGESQAGSGYSLLLLPFFHVIDASHPDAEGRLNRASGRWSHFFCRLGGDSRSEPSEPLLWAIDDSYFLAPSARALFFGDLVKLEADRASEGPLPPRQLANAVQRLIGEHQDLAQWRGPHQTSTPGYTTLERPSSALRLTLKRPELAKLAGLTLGDPGLPLDIAWVDVVLFPQQCGVLVLKVRHDARWDHDTLVRFSEEVRQIWAPKVSLRLPPLKIGADEIEWLQIIEWLLDDFVDGEPTGAPSPREVSEDARYRVRYVTSTEAQVVGTNFRMVHFVLADHDPNDRRRRLVELVTGHSLIGDWVVSADQLARLDQENFISYWDNWTGLLWWENLAVIASPSEFSRSVLSANVESDYLWLVLLTLFQQARLGRFMNELDGRAMSLEHNARETLAIATRVRHFYNEFWFDQPTTAPLGLHLHGVLRRVFRLDQLLAEVQRETALLNEAYSRQIEGALNRAVAAITVVGLPLAFLVGLLAGSVQTWRWLRDRPTWLGAGVIVALSVGVSGLIYKAYRSWLSRPR